MFIPFLNNFSITFTTNADKHKEYIINYGYKRVRSRGNKIHSRIL